MDTAFLIHGHRGFALSRIVQRLMGMGMTKHHSRIICTQIQRWIRCNGVIWTIDRLKAIKLAYVNYKAGVETSIPWLSRDRKGIPKGPFSVLKSYKWPKVVRFLNLHKLFVLDRITPAQSTKFLSAVSRPPVDPILLDQAVALVKLGYIPDKVSDKLSSTKPDPLVNANPSSYPHWGEICLEGLPPVPRNLQRKSLEDPSQDDLRSMMAADCLDFLRLSFNRNLLGPYLKDLFAPLGVRHLIKNQAVADPLCSPSGGYIGVSQEPGGKLRCFAAPFLPYQLVLKPLERTLKSRLNNLETDFTSSQEAGAARIQTWLNDGEGTFVTAFDLSSATDNFPLELQTAWMYSSGIDRIQLEIFEKISRLPWVPAKFAVDQGFPCSPVKWTVGQPQGLVGSFFSFALTHNYLLRGIEKSIFGEVRNEFCVLGDDVVIRDELVAMKYHLVLTGLGVPISMDKSILSDRLSEFAGFIITETGMNKGTKLTKVTRNSVIELGRTYGPSSRRMVQKVVGNDELVGALEAIPACIGGLGWGNSSLTEALRPKLNADLFGALTKVKERETTLPKRLKTAVQHSVYASLGYSLSDWSPNFVSKTHIQDLQSILPDDLSFGNLELMEAHAYILTQEKIEMCSRKAISYLMEGDYESHNNTKKFIRVYNSILKNIESRYQSSVPDNIQSKLRKHPDSILGEMSSMMNVDVVTILSNYYEHCTRSAPKAILSTQEFLDLLGIKTREDAELTPGVHDPMYGYVLEGDQSDTDQI